MPAQKTTPYIACAIFVLFALQGNAQFFFGIKAGYVSSSIAVDSNSSSISSFSRLSGFCANMVISTGKINNSCFEFSVEPGYIQKGAKVKDSLKYKFHYLDVPFMIHFSPAKMICFQVGPEFSYLLYGENKNSEKSITNTFDNRFDLSGSVGASLALTFFMDLGVKYNQSFIQLAAKDSESGNTNLKNQYFQVYLLFKIVNY